MWRLCKELNGTKSLNERDYLPHGEIMGVGFGARTQGTDVWKRVYRGRVGLREGLPARGSE